MLIMKPNDKTNCISIIIENKTLHFYCETKEEYEEYLHKFSQGLTRNGVEKIMKKIDEDAKR